MSPNPKTLIFLHIPRTGGTTLKRLPDRNYGRGQTLTFYNVDHSAAAERFARLPESERAHCRFIQGHLYFGFHRFVPNESTYVTFLREPISRLLSFYSYARTHTDHYLYQLITEERLSLKQLLERKEASEELLNLQTRIIAGVEPSGGVDRMALEQAKENLRTHFSFVGLTEEFSASLLLLARTLGWSFPFHVKRNASRKKNPWEQAGSETLAMLREANSLDLELYEFGRALFQAQLERAGESFEPELRRFQKMNFLGAHAYEQYENVVRRAKKIIGREDSGILEIP